MTDATETPRPRDATLIGELRRVAKLHADRRADPGLARKLLQLARWQSARLAHTYDDLARSPRYADAIAFFRSDLYGAADFARRDADLARAAPAMTRLLPERVLATVGQAIELNILSQQIDQRLLAHLPAGGGPFTVADYCHAYRTLDNREERLQQLRLSEEFGAALDVYVTKPFLRGALVMMRHPARAAGLSALQAFLERGFAAFRKMRGATEFLATIDRRERALMDTIFAGETAPFADPLVLSEGGRST